MYNLLRLFLGMIFKNFFRWEIKGIENIPLTGGVIIASNHISLWDPPVIGSAIPKHRQVHFMAKQELFETAIFGWIITKLGAFPVKRGMADRTAIRTAMDILKNGDTLGLFPEGTRSKTGKLGTPEPGLALIAIKTGCPIVPTAVFGTNKIFSDGNFFPKLKVIFGKPILIDQERSDKEYMAELSNLLMNEISIILSKNH